MGWTGKGQMTQDSQRTNGKKARSGTVGWMRKFTIHHRLSWGPLGGVEWEGSPFTIGPAVGTLGGVVREVRRCPQPCWREDGIQSRLGEFNDCSTSGFPLHLLFSPSPLRFPLRCACDLRCEGSASCSSCQGCFWLPCLSSTIVGSYPSRTVNSLFLELPLITEFY